MEISWDSLLRHGLPLVLAVKADLFFFVRVLLNVTCGDKYFLFWYYFRDFFPEMIFLS